MMEVSTDYKNPDLGPLQPPVSPHKSTQLRKRTFSEVEDPNASKQPEAHKAQRGVDDGQENRDPSCQDHSMDIDKPVPSVDNMAMNITTDKPLHGSQPAQSITATPASMTASSVTTVPDVVSTPPRQQSQPSAAIALPNKKLKLSPSTKEAKRKEKEEKDRLKLEEKAKKDAEKKAKEEEKRKKEAEKEEERKKREAEREEKKRQKEEEKNAKEEERRKKEEEKEKKERSQMRLNAFFTKPTTNVTKAASPVPPSPQKDANRDVVNTESPQKPQNRLSDYRREFPVFFLQSHTHISPPHQFQRDKDALSHIRLKLDGYLKQPTALPAYRGSDLFDMIPFRRRKGLKVVSVKTILAQNADPNTSSTTLRDALKKVTLKSLRFGEDVRPPYYGTFTKQLSQTQAHKVCRTPHARILPEVDYDYDSEAEWEEPEEGEDLDSEGEEDASEDGDDDMDEFLDDDEEQMDSRRRLIVGDQEPICTGIRWEDGKTVDPDTEIYRMEVLSDTIHFPIDPFSTAYWPKPKAVEQAAPKVSSSLAPTRVTLHSFGVTPSTSTHTPSPLAPPARPVVVDHKSVSKAKKPFPPEYMEEFKQTVEGCDLSKAGLIEVLKKRFPKVSKDTLKDTVNAVAVRVGQKEADKKWTCK